MGRGRPIKKNPNFWKGGMFVGSKGVGVGWVGDGPSNKNPNFWKGGMFVGSKGVGVGWCKGRPTELIVEKVEY